MPRGIKDVEESATTTATKSKSKKKPNPLPSISTTTTTRLTSVSPQQHDAGFTEDDFKNLAKNEHGRYLPNSKKVGHAVLVEEEGKTVAMQYPLPVIGGGTVFTEENITSIVPEVRPLINIETIEPYHGMHRYRAETPNGTEMFGKRSVKGKIGHVGEQESTDIEIACFSPNPNNEPFWGSVKATPVLKEGLSSESLKDLQEMGSTVKGGKELQVDYESVRQRTLMKSRNPDQNTVMGESAKEAFEHFYEKMKDVLHPDMKMRLSRAFNANFHGKLFENNHRPEWLHLYGWKLAPMNTNPQTRENLGAGSKWANTQMMLLEGVIKFFAEHCPESIGVIKPTFFMLLDSDLIEHIDFEVKAQIKENYIKLEQIIDPYLQYPLFPKSSDLAQTAGIAFDLLHDIDPVSKQEVLPAHKPETRQQTVIRQAAAPILATAPLPLKATTIPPVVAEVASTGTPAKDSLAKLGVTAEQYQALFKTMKTDLRRKRNDSVSEEVDSDFKAKRVLKDQQFPTEQGYQKSVVQVCTTGFLPNYDTPWQAPEVGTWSGSGVVIAHPDKSGKKLVLTNAHVAQNANFMQVRLGNTSENYEARAKIVAYQCDLALLEVDDPEFNERVQAAELGDMVNLKQDVMTVGFPMGGNELSISTGIVSRIEVSDYSMSGQDLLQVQVDAAINHGNSGGPVFSGNKVVGIAFQGYDLQGLGFMIPIPIMRRFLAEAFSGRNYRGFPVPAFTTEALVNSSEREHYQMGERTGLRITKIDYLCDAYKKLKPDDILLAVDGLTLSNEGTVDIPGIGNRIYWYHVTQTKMLGESVKLKILRKNNGTKKSELFDIDIILDTIVGDTEKVGVPEYDKMPTYYFHSGVCFVPLTHNYLDGAAGDLAETFVLEEGCALPNISKKRSDEQIIIISHVLTSKKTQGYDKHIHEIVKEINGKPINNLRDVILAMESNSNSTQIITLAGNAKSKIIVPNMTASQLHELFIRHRMNNVADRSLDLQTKAVVPGAPKENTAAAMDISVNTQTRLKHKRGIIFSESEEESTTDESQEACLDYKSLTADMLPGLRKYNNKLDAMERFYSAHLIGEDEEDDDDYDEDAEEISLDAPSDEAEDDDEFGVDMEVEEEAHQVARAAPTLHRHNAVHSSGLSRFFHKPSKHKEDKEDEPDPERKHGGGYGRK